MAAVGGLGIPSCSAGLNIFESLLLSERFLAASSLFFSWEEGATGSDKWCLGEDHAANSRRSCGEKCPGLIKSREIWKKNPRLPARCTFSQPSAFFLLVLDLNKRRLNRKDADSTPELSIPHKSPLALVPAAAGSIGGNFHNGKNPRVWQERLMWFAGGLIS